MKEITINGMQYKVTNRLIERLTDSINETQQKLDLELSYIKSLQKSDMIAFYRDHVATLRRYLGEAMA